MHGLGGKVRYKGFWAGCIFVVPEQRKHWWAALIRVSKEYYFNLLQHECTCYSSGPKNPAKQNEPEKSFMPWPRQRAKWISAVCAKMPLKAARWCVPISRRCSTHWSIAWWRATKGRLCAFGDFGSFQVGVSSTGVKRRMISVPIRWKRRAHHFPSGHWPHGDDQDADLQEEDRARWENELPGENTGGNTGGTVPR